MKEYLRAKEAGELLGVTTQTVRKYHRQGKIKGYSTPGGQTIYRASELKEILGIDDSPKRGEGLTIHYLRASDGNKARLKTQKEQLEEIYGAPDLVISDKASGLNEKRKGLHRMIALAKDGKASVIRVTQKDRLTRFGFLYLEELFSAYGVEVEVAFTKDDKGLMEELMQDFMSLISSFAGKFYRLRGYAQQRELLASAERIVDEKEQAASEK